MNDQSLSHQFENLFRKIIDKRSFLVRTGRNKKNEATMRHFLDKLLPFRHSSFTDEGAAKFIINHENEIRQIIADTDINISIKFENLCIVAKQFSV